MDFGKTRTYERYSLRFRAQQSKLLSDLFDKVSADALGKGKEARDCPVTDIDPVTVFSDMISERAGAYGCPASQGNKIRRQQKSTERMEAVVPPRSGMEGMERMELSANTRKDCVKSSCSSPCPLFVTVCEEQSRPKKSKHAVSRPQAKGPRRRVKKSGGLYKKFQDSMKRSSAAPRVSTPVLTSPEYPSIETFRDLRKRSFSWSSVHKEVDSSCSRWLESMSSSDPEKTLGPSGGKQRDQTTLLPRPRLSSCGRQHSFIKIRTPMPVPAVERPQSSSNEQEEGDENSNEDEDVDEVSSYTSVYTWTTATTTNTGSNMAPATAHTGVSFKKGRRQEEEIGSSSHSLQLLPQAPDPLQSTAIHSHLDPPHLHSTPHVSPIRPILGDDGMHRTPAAPTHDVSPRGPRKTQSFLSTRDRAVPPKCSTMLFASPMADAGDAPIDVSSIKSALMEAIGPTEKENGDQEKLKNREKGEVGDQVLTSTPCGQHPDQLKWDLSSVQALVEEENVLQVGHCQDKVYLEETVADTLRESSLHGQDQQGDPASDGLGQRGKVGDKVLTSTPCKQRPDEFKWNLSSVQALVEDDEVLLLVDSSRDTVNSEEIVADSPSEASLHGHQDLLPASTMPKPGGKEGRLVVSGDNSSGQTRAECRVMLTRLPNHTDVVEHTHHTSSHLPPIPSHTSSVSEAFTGPLHHDSGGNKGNKQECIPSHRAQVSIGGDGLEFCGKELNSEHHKTHARQKSLQRKADCTASRSQSKEMPSGKNSVSTDQLSLPQMVGTSQHDVPQQGKQGGSMEEGEGDVVPPCPVSLTRGRGEVDVRPPLHKPGLLMRVEPSDSGFQDMVSNASIDIIDVVSRQAKKATFPSLM